MESKRDQSGSKIAKDSPGAVLYIRVSTDEQAVHGVSLGAQEERLRAYCTMRGLEVIDLIRDEGVSAFKPLRTRSGGAGLLRAISSGQATHIVTLKLDRLFRNAADALTLTEAWSGSGWLFISSTWAALPWTRRAQRGA